MSNSFLPKGWKPKVGMIAVTVFTVVAIIPAGYYLYNKARGKA